MIISALWLLLAISFFYFGIQHPPSLFRCIFNILHVGGAALSLWDASLHPSPYFNAWATFLVWGIMHTSSVLFMESCVVDINSAGFENGLRDVYGVMCNLRRLPLSARAIETASDEAAESRISFAARKSARALALLALDYSIDLFVRKSLRHLMITVEDFAPAKQGLLPPLTYHDLCLRAIMSMHWIWSTFALLSSAHDLFAIVFVCVFRWDLPSGWPRLFGNMADAYSLRRFWGAFWHHLHRASFAAYMPPFILDLSFSLKGRLGSPWGKIGGNGLKSLWIFLLSAGCHILVNLVVLRINTTRQELRFFLSNFLVCLLETVVQSILLRKLARCAGSNTWLRVLGYAWVFVSFFCTVPAWKYPTVYSALRS